jgi:hypothetical protein
MGTSVNARSDVWLDGVTVAGQDLRLQQASANLTGTGASGTTGIGARPGVRNGVGTPLLVTAAGGMNIGVAAGVAFVQGTAAVNAGMYTVCLDTAATLTVTTSDLVNPRIDNVIAQVVDVGSSSSTTTISIQAGIPASSPVAPALPANSLLLATIAVAANATTLVSGNIADARVYTVASGGVLPYGNVLGATIPGPKGTAVYDMATDRWKSTDGAGHALPMRVTAFAPVQSVITSNVVIPVSALFGTLVSVSVTTDATTEIEISAMYSGWFQTTANTGDHVDNQFYLDGSPIFLWTVEQTGVSGNLNGGAGARVFETPGAGTHTISWKVACSGTAAMTLYATSTSPAVLRVAPVPG